MSRFALLKHHVAAPGGGPSYSLVQSPELSGEPRVGQLAYVYGGDYSSAPTHLRYTQQRIDPTTLAVTNLSPVVQDVTALGNAAYSYQFNWAAGDQDLGYSMLVEASFDNQSSWPISTICDITTTYTSDVILPAVIPDGSITRTSSSGTLPMTFNITSPGYSALVRYMMIEAADLSVVKYLGVLPITEAERNSPNNIDLTGVTDPAPEPAIPSLLATDVLTVWEATPDWENTGNLNQIVGAANNPRWISPTDRSGTNRIRITNTHPTNNAFLNKIGIEVGGIDILRSVSSDGDTFFARGFYSSDPNREPSTFSPKNLTGNAASITGEIAANGGWVEFDLPNVSSPITVKLYSVNGWGPLTDGTIKKDGVTAQTLTGVTYTPDEVKAYTI